MESTISPEIMYSPSFRDEIFKMHLTLDSEIEENKLDAFNEEIQRYLNEIIEKETEIISPRSFHRMKELLIKVENKLQLEYETTFMNKEEYVKWTQKQRNRIQSMKEDEMIKSDLLVEELANLEKTMDSSTYELIWLLSQVKRQLINTCDEINRTLLSQQHKRRKITEQFQIINVFTGIMIIVFRLYEIKKHWELGDEKTRQLIKDLMFWDLDTLKNLTVSLPSDKSRKKTKGKPESRLIEVLWGD